MPHAHERPIQSSVTLRQHPLHPMVVVFPTAFLLTTCITDLVYWWRGDAFWALASLWLSAAGLVTGALAAVLGLIDFIQLRQVRVLIAGWSHMLVAIMSLALAAASLRLRIDDPVGAVLPWGLVISTTLFLMVAITGWLGGTLTFRHGIGSYVHEHDAAAAGSDVRTLDEGGADPEATADANRQV